MGLAKKTTYFLARLAQVGLLLIFIASQFAIFGSVSNAVDSVPSPRELDKIGDEETCEKYKNNKGCYNIGVFFFNEKRFSTAGQEFGKVCESGLREACRQAAVSYDRSNNFSEAFYWAKRGEMASDFESKNLAESIRNKITPEEVGRAFDRLTPKSEPMEATNGFVNESMDPSAGDIQEPTFDEQPSEASMSGPSANEAEPSESMSDTEEMSADHADSAMQKESDDVNFDDPGSSEAPSEPLSDPVTE